MRKRLRDWPITVCKYGVYLPHSSTPPQRLADEALAMRDMWHLLLGDEQEKTERYRAILTESVAVADAQTLVAERQEALLSAQTALKAAHQQARKRAVPDADMLQSAITRARAALQDAYSIHKTARQAAKDAHRERIAALQAEYDAKRRHLRSTIKTVDGGNREFILDKFATAVRMARKKGIALREQHGFPTEINYAHLFTSGWPVERLFLGSSGKVSFGERQCRDSRRLNDIHVCSFKVRNETLTFDVLYHRPLPRNALIKSIVLHGDLVRRAGYQESPRDGQTHRVNARWKWSLLVTCEVPPADQRDTPARSCGLDVGYRLMPDGGLRVAYLVDDAGHKEDWRLPSEMVQRLRHQWAMQAEADQLRERVTDTIKHLPIPPDLSAEGRAILTQQIGFPGLRRLYVETEQCEPCALREALRQWMVASTTLYFAWRGNQRSVSNWRRDLYRRWAYHVCQRYGTIAIEQLNVKQLGEQEKESLGHGEVGKYRHFAAVGELLLILKQTAKREGRVIQLRDPANTTRSCPVCGEFTESDHTALFLTCPKGHRYDQDEGAATNIHAPRFSLAETKAENAGA